MFRRWCRYGNTLLHIAAQRDNADVLRVLIKEGEMNINAANSLGITPLVSAVMNNSQVCIANPYGKQAFTLTAIPSQKSVQALVDERADVNQQNDEGS